MKWDDKDYVFLYLINQSYKDRNVSVYIYICPQIVVMLKIKKGKFENEKVNCWLYTHPKIKVYL